MIRLLMYVLPLAFLSPSLTTGQDQEPLVTIVPEQSDAILANPSMGWQTFHRTSKADKNLPSWIPSTVHYARWGWRDLEPEPGKIKYDFLDKMLQESRDSGQKLAFRVMCCSTSPRQPYHPQWLRDVGGKVVTTRYESGPELEVPVLDDPTVLAAHLDFISRLGSRYDGHLDIDHIDLGTVGWWGEWHMSQSTNAPMPTMESQKKIVDAYLAAFRNTQLVMLIGGGEMLEYAVENGAGWRADCLGDLGGFSKTWCHMRMAYPQMLPAANAVDAWKSAPVAWETCWDMRKWVEEGWSLRFIFDYALALHGSVINNKSAPLPDGENVRAELERFLRRLGYRLILRELTHPAQVRAGEKLNLGMKWQNIGSAPCYRPYRVAWRLTASDGQHRVFVSNIAVNQWLPGSIELFTEEFFKQPPDLPPGEFHNVAWALSVPEDLSAGTYTLSIAVVGEQEEHPVVQLGIEGRAEDGWYPLSRVTVVR